MGAYADFEIRRKGPRGIRAARKRRLRREHARTLQRNAWRTYFELMKRVGA